MLGEWIVFIIVFQSIFSIIVFPVYSRLCLHVRSGSGLVFEVEGWAWRVERVKGAGWFVGVMKRRRNECDEETEE